MYRTLLAVAVIALLPLCALASPLGFALNDPAAERAAAQLESGDADAAVDELVALLRDKSASDPQRNPKIQLALAMAYVRRSADGDAAKASAILRSLASRPEPTASLALLLQTVAAQAPKDGQTGARADLKPRDAWHAVVALAHTDLTTRLKSQDDQILAAIGEDRWADLPKALANAKALFRASATVTLDPERSSDIAAAHAESMRQAVQSANKRGQLYHERCASIAGDPGKRRRAAKQKSRDPATHTPDAIREHDRYRQLIEQALEKTKPLQQEWQDLIARPDVKLPRERALRIRIDPPPPALPR